MDNVVDKLDEAIKLYVTKLTRGSLDEREGHRAMEIISFTINLEHVGDIIDKNLTELAAKKIKRKLQFSERRRARSWRRSTSASWRACRIALGVFMSGDVKEARKLIAEKAQLRNAELAAAERHLERLRAGRPETLETTSLHLDVLRDLKRIHSHICSVAYPVLEAAGEMSGRRRRRERPHHRRRREPEADRAITGVVGLPAFRARACASSNPGAAALLVGIGWRKAGPRVVLGHPGPLPTRRSVGLPVPVGRRQAWPTRCCSSRSSCAT